MKYELRRMAIALVGVPDNDNENHKAASQFSAAAHPTILPDGSTLQVPFGSQQPPIYPSVQLDDAVLHFRCGALIAAKHRSFGFMKFASFSRHLSPTVRSIGIVTQPFELHHHQQRTVEQNQDKLDKCRLVVTALVQHLQERFPTTVVTVRNDANETIALAFARMIMANQTVVAISSFGVMPAIVTFGTGYVRKPDYPKAPNQFLLHGGVSENSNVVLIEEPRLPAAQLNKLWNQNGSTAVLDWFR